MRRNFSRAENSLGNHGTRNPIFQILRKCGEIPAGLPRAAPAIGSAAGLEVDRQRMFYSTQGSMGKVSSRFIFFRNRNSEISERKYVLCE